MYLMISTPFQLDLGSASKYRTLTTFYLKGRFSEFDTRPSINVSFKNIDLGCDENFNRS